MASPDIQLHIHLVTHALQGRMIVNQSPLLISFRNSFLCITALTVVIIVVAACVVVAIGVAVTLKEVPVRTLSGVPVA